MADVLEGRRALGDRAARQLANTTKTVAQHGAITPRWLVRFLSWVPVEAGTLRINPGLRLIGTAAEKAGVVSCVLDGFRSEDVGTALDREGIAVRAGHHCAQPALRRYGLESTVRPSLALYNTRDDIDALTGALRALARGRASLR